MDAPTPHSGPTAQTTPAIAELSGVSVTLAGNAGAVDILRGIDLAIAGGSTNAIVGPSGSARTPLPGCAAAASASCSSRSISSPP
jgi:putative ABC transport system ATP-binding protein